MERVIGIYKITHIATGRCYIGQSINVDSRRSDHARAKGASSFYLSATVKKYGWAEFSFETLETCAKENLNEREKHWIAHFNCISPNGFNLTSGGKEKSSLSEESKSRIAKTLAGRCTREPWTAEQKAAKSAQMMGKKLAPEVYAKQAQKRTGVKRSKEACEAISAGNKGKVFSPAHRAAIAEAAKRRGEEWRNKISETKRLRNAQKRSASLSQNNITNKESAA